jgi:hypothetical protein
MLDRIRNWITMHPPRVIVLGWMLVLTLLAVAGLLLVRGAHAATLTGTFALPTQYEDGTPLPVANIKHIRVEVGTCVAGPAFGMKEGEQLVPPPATAFSATAPRAFGQFCVRAQTETVSGMLSAWTGVVTKTITEPNPKPPVLSSSITIAYETWQFRDKVYLGRSVGTLPLGTPCGAAVYQSFGATYYEIPREAVTFTKAPKAGPLVTQCKAS